MNILNPIARDGSSDSSYMGSIHIVIPMERMTRSLQDLIIISLRLSSWLILDFAWRIDPFREYI
jgi:hypothetical protein